MADPKFFNSLAKLGLQMFEPREELDVNTTLAEVVKSSDPRLREGFPVLLANAANGPRFSQELVLAQLPHPEQQELFRHLLLLSAAVYSLYHLSFAWLGKLKKGFSKDELRQVAAWRAALAANQVPEGPLAFDPERVKGMFALYSTQKVASDKRRMDKLEEFSLEHALSQVFSPKQKELFQKRLAGTPLTKTELEYYSRTVKKTVVALANTELHNLARKLLER